MNSPDRLLGESALQAYRADIPVGGADPSKHASDAVLIATLARQSLIGDADAGGRIRARALDLARESLGPAAIAQGGTYDDHPVESDVDLFLLLSHRTEVAGWLRLAQHLLESTARAAKEPIEQGRVLAERVRNSRKQGHIDLSIDQNLELHRFARRIGSPELQAKARYALAAAAQTRGNYVEVRSNLLKMISIARKAGLKRLQAAAHSGLGTHDAMSGSYGEAVAHLWSAYQKTDGVGIIATGALINLAQTLLLSGRPAEGRKIGRLVLSTMPALQSALPALGGYALACAQLNDPAGVDWACTQVRRLSKSRHYRREVAGATLECAVALELVGKGPQAGVMRRRAVSLAETYGFHDLTFAEGGGQAATPRVVFRGAAARATASIEEMDLPPVPENLEAVLA